MSLSRRSFLQASGLALVAGALPLRAQASGSQPALPVPPLIESRRGQPLFLTMQSAHWAFLGGNKAPVWGFNGMYLGPTVRVYNGDDVKLIYSNRLSEPVSMTVSGLQVPGTLAGGGARMISPVLTGRQCCLFVSLPRPAGTTPTPQTAWDLMSIMGWQACGWSKMKSAKTYRYPTTTVWMTSR